MASTYKTFSNNDLATTRTLLHEVIPITGSIVSGTYVEGTTSETNIASKFTIYIYIYCLSHMNLKNIEPEYHNYRKEVSTC